MNSLFQPESAPFQVEYQGLQLSGDQICASFICQTGNSTAPPVNGASPLSSIDFLPSCPRPLLSQIFFLSIPFCIPQ